MKIMNKQDFNAFVDDLIRDGSLDVQGVKSKGDQFAFGPLDSSGELRLDHDVTILPPKKYFMPQYETLMKFDLSDPFNIESTKATRRTIIIGVHPYDIVAIRQMDSYYLDTDVSASYLKRRRNTLIIGSDVLSTHDKAFFGSMGTGEAKYGYDLFISDLGDQIAIEIGTREGARLLERASNVGEASSTDVRKVKDLRDSAVSSAGRDLKVKPGGWHDLLSKNFDSVVWKEQSDKCLSCGSCTLVCPTCFCYDVQDQINLDLTTGERKRTWDGCLLRQFTEVGSGEVFREDIVDRYRHRFHRKGKYLPDRLGFVACVGCGRCASQCVPDIADPVILFNKLYEAAPQPIVESGNDPHSVKTELAEIPEDEFHPLHRPMAATLKRVEKLTENETLFEIELDSLLPLGHRPGQFVEVSIMGTGEAPISVSSAPGDTSFEIVVRKVGDVTGKLHTLSAGDKIGIRGPFGNGFDTVTLKGKDLLFICAGLGVVPIRSFINYVLGHRADYGKVFILYGCKEPAEQLFLDEVGEWRSRADVDYIECVDTCPEGQCWEGNTGVITTLIPMADFDPKDTVAIVVGPPIVYRFVNRDLLNMGVPEENIIVSLERRMKCGVGKCGHCQINGLYACKDGPVFNYKDIKDLPEAFS